MQTHISPPPTEPTHFTQTRTSGASTLLLTLRLQRIPTCLTPSSQEQGPLRCLKRSDGHLLVEAAEVEVADACATSPHHGFASLIAFVNQKLSSKVRT